MTILQAKIVKRKRFLQSISIVSEPQQIYSVALDEQELHLVENFREMDSSQRDLLKKIGDTFKSR